MVLAKVVKYAVNNRIEFLDYQKAPLKSGVIIPNGTDTVTLEDSFGSTMPKDGYLYYVRNTCDNGTPVDYKVVIDKNTPSAEQCGEGTNIQTTYDRPLQSIYRFGKGTIRVKYTPNTRIEFLDYQKNPMKLSSVSSNGVDTITLDDIFGSALPPNGYLYYVRNICGNSTPVDYKVVIDQNTPLSEQCEGPTDADILVTYNAPSSKLVFGQGIIEVKHTVGRVLDTEISNYVQTAFKPEKLIYLPDSTKLIDNFGSALPRDGYLYYVRNRCDNNSFSPYKAVIIKP
jgi:hypothetical protein